MPLRESPGALDGREDRSMVPSIALIDHSSKLGLMPFLGRAQPSSCGP